MPTTLDAHAAPGAAGHGAPMAVDTPRSEATYLAGLVVKVTAHAPPAITTEEGAAHKRFLPIRPLQDGVAALAEHFVASLLQPRDGQLVRLLAARGPRHRHLLLEALTATVGETGSPPQLSGPREQLRSPTAPLAL